MSEIYVYFLGSIWQQNTWEPSLPYWRVQGWRSRVRCGSCWRTAPARTSPLPALQGDVLICILFRFVQCLCSVPVYIVKILSKITWSKEVGGLAASISTKGRTLERPWLLNTLLLCPLSIMDLLASPVGSHALDAGGVQIRGLPSDLVQVGSHKCGNWNTLIFWNLRQICCKVSNVRSMARCNLNIKSTWRQHI